MKEFEGDLPYCRGWQPSVTCGLLFATHPLHGLHTCTFPGISRCCKRSRGGKKAGPRILLLVTWGLSIIYKGLYRITWKLETYEGRTIISVNSHLSASWILTCCVIFVCLRASDIQCSKIKRICQWDRNIPLDEDFETPCLKPQVSTVVRYKRSFWSWAA